MLYVQMYIVLLTWSFILVQTIDSVSLASYAKNERCREKLGLEDDKIPDRSITASSSYSKLYAPYNGRLNHRARGFHGGAWAPRQSDKRQWFQVDFSEHVVVTGVATQGRENADEWITSYMLSYSEDGVEYRTYYGREIHVIFKGNIDRNTVVRNFLQPPIAAVKFIRVLPVMWHRRIALRAEFLGCDSAEKSHESSTETQNMYMSYLNVPRLHFLGRFQADTCTTNNKVVNYDINKFTRRSKLSAQEHPDGGGGWNPKGTNDWRIDQCKVTSVCYYDGKCKTWQEPTIQEKMQGKVKTDDPVLGATVADDTSGTAAKIVDLDPQDMTVSTVYGWRIRVGNLFSADFQPAPLKGYWSKETASKGDSGSGGEYQSVLLNIKWLSKANSSKFIKQIRSVMKKIGSKELSIHFNVDLFDINRTSPLFTWGRIAGIIGIQGPSSYPFHANGRVLRPQTEVMQTRTQFIIDNRLKWISLDLGNTLPITKNGGFPNSLGTLTVGFAEEIEPEDLNCSSRIKWLGKVPYKQHLWYRNTTGVVSLPVSVEDIHKLSNRRLILAQVTGNESSCNCSRIFLEEAKDGLEVCPCDEWVFRKEAGETVSLKVFVTRFGRLQPNITVELASIESSGGSNEPIINVPVLYTPTGPIISNSNGIATITIYTRDPGNPRKVIDGQIYFYLYGLSSEDLDDNDKSVRIHVYNNYTYSGPPDWITHIYPILKQYANLFPVMTEYFLDLGNYDEVVKSKELIEMSMTLPESHPNYMPVTRDLSQAKKQMILKWLGQKHPLKGREKESYTIQRLREHLQMALQIEHATIPPYLTALVSIKPGFNTEVKNIIKTIIRQEMLHMALVANLLNAIGGKPKLFYRDFILRYPSRLPGELHPKLVVPLEKCSIGLIRNVFMKIEEPIFTEQLMTDRRRLMEIYHRNMDHVDGSGNAYIRDIGNHNSMINQFDTIKRKRGEHIKKHRDQNYEFERKTETSRDLGDALSRERDKASKEDRNSNSIEYNLFKSEKASQEEKTYNLNIENNLFFTKCIPREEENEKQQRDDDEPDMQDSLGDLWNEPLLRHYNTIGSLYNLILKALGYLTNCGQNNGIFTGDPKRQITPDHWMSHKKSEKPNIFKVVDYKSAVDAVKEIVEQGEGSSPCNPLAVYANHTDELSHYFLFSSIVEGYNLTIYPKGKSRNQNWQEEQSKPKRCEQMYNFDGPKIPFDPSGVWPIKTNPQMSTYQNTRIFAMANTFNKIYTQLLKNLENVFNGHPNAIIDTMGLMYSVTLYAKRLVSTPLDPNGDPHTGPNAAPTYTFTSD